MQPSFDQSEKTTRVFCVLDECNQRDAACYQTCWLILHPTTGSNGGVRMENSENETDRTLAGHCGIGRNVCSVSIYQTVVQKEKLRKFISSAFEKRASFEDLVSF